MKRFLALALFLLSVQAEAQTVSPLVQSGPTSQRPARGGEGTYFDTDIGGPVFWDGRFWNSQIASRTSKQPMIPQDFASNVGSGGDDTAAFQAMASFYNTNNREIYVPDGEYYISSPIVIVPPAISAIYNAEPPPAIKLSKRAHIIASVSMNSIFQFGTDATDYSGLVRNGLIEGGVFDCNGKANFGIYIPFVNTALVQLGEIRSCLSNDIRFGSPSSPTSGYEGLFDHMKFTATWTNINISYISQAASAVVTTSVPHNFAVGNTAYIQNVGGMTQINQLYCTISSVTLSTFTCSNINSSAFSAYTSGGQTDKTVLAVSGCVGYQNTGDSQGSNSVGGGCAFGVAASDALSGYDGKWTNNHFWNFPEQGRMIDGFYLRGDNQIIGNQIDGPVYNAYHVTALGNHLIGNSFVYSGALAGVAGQSNGLYLDTGAGAELVGDNWKADDATKPIANGVVGDLTNVKVISLRCVNVTANCPSMVIPGLPTTAPTVSGSFWRNGNVLNVVP